MTAAQILRDAFGRLPALVAQSLRDLSPAEVTARVGLDANSIAWLIWHLARIQDDHLAAVGGWEQIWVSDDFVTRFALPFDVAATGYGQTSEEVASVTANGELLQQYFDATHARTMRYLEDLHDEELDRIVDRSFQPPVTLGVRLVSVLSDNLQHIGQAAFVRGILIDRR